MKTRRVTLALAAWLTAASAALAIDTVKTTTGGSVLGNVTKMTALEVTTDVSGVQKTTPVNQVEVIYYDSEPTMLKTARSALEAGRYQDALDALAKIDPSDVSRAEIKQDAAYYKALAAARLAVAGGGNVKEAGSRLVEFVNAYPNSYHYFEACEVIGDLLVAAGNYANAETYYGYLATKAPWPDYKMRSGVAVGRAKLAAGNPGEAMKAFEAVLDIEAQGEAADKYRLAATLGKARCLAEDKKADEAVKLIQGVIDRANPEDADLQAAAYNALGAALRKAGRAKDALLAFLHVDVLYFTAPGHHIEALQNLNELWLEVQKPDRAARAVQVLRDRYNTSPRNQ